MTLSSPLGHLNQYSPELEICCWINFLALLGLLLSKITISPKIYQNQWNNLFLVCASGVMLLVLNHQVVVQHLTHFERIPDCHLQ